MMIDSQKNLRAFRPFYGLICLCLLGFGFLSACTPVGVLVGAGATVGVAAYQERGVEQAARDQKTEFLIGAAFLDHPSALLSDLNIEVYENRVLLTGFAKDEDDMADAVRLAWKNPEVKEVINEIRIKTGEAGDFDGAKDTWISTKLRGQLTTDGQVFAINYAIETVAGTVYLIGIGQSKAEVGRVINHARQVSGVKKVISHVRIKDPIDPK